MAIEQRKKAEGKALTLAELEQFATNLRYLGATGETPVRARINWGGTVRELAATFDEPQEPQLVTRL